MNFNFLSSSNQIRILSVLRRLSLSSILGALLLGLAPAALADTCDVGEAPHPAIAGRNFLMEMPSGRALLVVGTKEISNDERTQFSEMYWSQEPAGEDIPKKLSDLLKSHTEHIKAAEGNVAFLREMLSQRKLGYVAIESDEATFDIWNKVASDLYMHEFVQSVRRKIPQEDAWRKLLLITIGAPLYLKQSQPQSFQDVRFTNVNVNAETQKLVGAGSQVTDEVLRKRAAEKTASLLRELEDNPRSRHAFQRAIAQVRPGSSFLRGKSDAEIKHYVLARTWRPIRGQVSQWLDAQLAAIHQKPQQEAPTLTIREPMFEQIRGFNSSGVLFASEQNIAALSQRLQVACRDFVRSAGRSNGVRSSRRR